MCILLLLVTVSTGSSPPTPLPEGPSPAGSYGDPLQYDDGTAAWLAWTGTYRGTWFDITDFGLSGSWTTTCTEIWCYHHASFPWDVSSFYCDLYKGDQQGPAYWLDQTSLVAMHFQPCFAQYAQPITIDGEDFWVIVNTEMSANCSPSTLSDGSQAPVDHSFYSDDFFTWIPWDPYSIALMHETWGEVKTLFREPASREPACSLDYLIRSHGLEGGSCTATGVAR